MKTSPNTYELPASMQRLAVPPVAPPAPAPMRYVPACLLGVCCALLALFALAFHPYPESMEPGFWHGLTRVAPCCLLFAVMSWVLALALSLVAVMAQWSRFCNAFVLLLCWFAPILSLLLGVGLKWCLCPEYYVY